MEEKDLLDTGAEGAQNYSGSSQMLPNATPTLVLGIISIVGCIFYGIPGLICGIIALVLHKKDKALYKQNPNKYAMSYKNARAGYVCAVIGTSLSAFYFLILIVYLIFFISVFPTLIKWLLVHGKRLLELNAFSVDFSVRLLRFLKVIY